MNMLTKITILSVLSLATLGCYDSSSEQAAPVVIPKVTPTIPVTPPVIVGNAADGLIYYNNNCAICHAAGSADTSTVFSASDLKQPGGKLIVSNMSAYSKSFNLMKKFDNVPLQRVQDLNAYINSIQQAVITKLVIVSRPKIS